MFILFILLICLIIFIVHFMYPTHFYLRYTCVQYIKLNKIIKKKKLGKNTNKKHDWQNKRFVCKKKWFILLCKSFYIFSVYFSNFINFVHFSYVFHGFFSIFKNFLVLLFILCTKYIYKYISVCGI